MFALLLKIFPGLVTGVLEYLNKKQDVELEKYKVDGTVDIEAMKAQAAIIAASQPGWFSIHSARAAFAWIMVGYFGKAILYDKVFAYFTGGSTDPVEGQLAVMVGVVLTGVFAAGSAETIVKLLKRG